MELFNQPKTMYVCDNFVHLFVDIEDDEDKIKEIHYLIGSEFTVFGSVEVNYAQTNRGYLVFDEKTRESFVIADFLLIDDINAIEYKEDDLNYV